MPLGQTLLENAGTGSLDGVQDMGDGQEQTRFESKRKVMALLDAIQKGKHDYSFIALARHVSNAVSLDLSIPEMQGVQKAISEIWALYQAEFPEPTQPQGDLPNALLQPKDAAGAYTPASVKASIAIESEEEYQTKLALYLEECRKAVNTSAEEYIDQRLALVMSPLESQKVIKRLDRIAFMREPGRHCSSTTAS